MDQKTEWLYKSVLLSTTAEAGAFNNNGSAQIQHCEAFCDAKVRLLYVKKGQPIAY